MNPTNIPPDGARASLLDRTLDQAQPSEQDYLEVLDLTVDFDGFKAVDGVKLTVTPGDLRFLIGPNGAGKTTIIDALTGLVPAKGTAQFAGRDLLGLPPHRIVRLGVGRTFQTASVIEGLTTLQNLDVAAGLHRSAWSRFRRRRDVPEEVTEVLETIGLADLADVPAGILAHGQKQWLEIGMLLVQRAQVLLLDEPVAGMSAAEREQTGQLLMRIGRKRVVVVVEHDMEFLRSFADSVTVLHQGKVLAEGGVAEVQANPAVIEVYLGAPAPAAAEQAGTTSAAKATPAARVAKPASAALPTQAKPAGREG
ncbi:MAG: urea ABC transporter ATP-binding protein UrtD [Bifidobacteriaceae bacterium]|jgi:urea transport system ATP-binding protein|nr:urea ABC transporter ATP-binding protein UrtD [Bifidobacteriaceae bacterium]